MVNLKQKANELSIDINNNSVWFYKECSFVIEGSHRSGDTIYNYLLDTLDINKPKFGKRANNVIAYVGNQCIQDIYALNVNQALSVWKYLSKEDKTNYNDVIVELLENFYNENMKG